MTAISRVPLTNPAPWRGRELTSSDIWRHHLTSADIIEIDNALGSARDVAWNELTPSTFKLPNLGATLRNIGLELADGSGVAKLAGLPVSSYSDARLRAVYLGLSAHLGTATEQNGARGLLRAIRDRSLDGGKRVDSADALNWHNDRTDVVGLLCVHEAARGGVSKVVSATAIHNAMLERCPDLLDVLFQDFNRYAPGDEVGGTDGCHALPIFRMDGARLSTHYSRTYIDQAANLPGGTPLDTHQTAALQALVSIADEFGYEMTLKSGEIQFLNNHAILHGRTAFEDTARRGAERLLLRVWLSTGAKKAWEA